MLQLGLVIIITFLSAFLLFQIELIVGKIFLANFGGSYLVWGACLVFFQAFLLLGYAYSNYVINFFGIKRYRYFHLLLFFLPLLFFPGHSLPLKFSIGDKPMVLEVFINLIQTIGPAFFVLSTMSVFCQSFFGSSNLPQKENPYALFAVSNFGSFLGLFLYPLLFEMVFDLYKQQFIWRIGYFLLLGLITIAMFSIKVSTLEKEKTTDDDGVTAKEVYHWLLYSAAGVIMMMAITNIVTAEVTPMPLLWVIPLAIYLLTFVLNFNPGICSKNKISLKGPAELSSNSQDCIPAISQIAEDRLKKFSRNFFKLVGVNPVTSMQDFDSGIITKSCFNNEERAKRKPWGGKWIKNNIHQIIGFSILLYFIMQKAWIHQFIQIIILFVILYLIAMFSQERLYQLRPKNNIHLPFFYLIISLGGFLGGMSVSWILPILSTSFMEYFVGLLLIALAYQSEGDIKKLSFYSIRLGIYFFVILAAWPLVFVRYSLFGLVLMVVLFKALFGELKNYKIIVSIILVLIIFLNGVIEPLWSGFKYRYKVRNYYGISEVFDRENFRFLLHGSTIHGAQSLIEKQQYLPLTYYAPFSPVGGILISDIFKFRDICVIGLGVGSIFSYLTFLQNVDVLEIDPEIYKIASKYFTFMPRSKANVTKYVGDGRMILEKQINKQYDLIIADAFSGDSVPVHLLTKEAIELYKKHLKNEGIILFNISNRYVDNGLPIFATALSLDGYTAYKHTEGRGGIIYEAVWVAVTWDRGQFKKLINDLEWKGVPKEGVKNIRPWSDKYSSILPYIQWKQIFKGIKKHNYLRLW